MSAAYCAADDVLLRALAGDVAAQIELRQQQLRRRDEARRRRDELAGEASVGAPSALPSHRTYHLGAPPPRWQVPAEEGDIVARALSGGVNWVDTDLAASFAECVEAAVDLAQFVSQIASRGEFCDHIGPAELPQNRSFTLILDLRPVDVPLEHARWIARHGKRSVKP